jgi:hypothetical protein
MKDICLVPTFRRPEYLWLCLEQLERCEGVQDLQVVVAIDEHLGRPADPAVREVARRFAGNLDVTCRTCPAHRFEGNSFNVLRNYVHARAAGARFVFLVEDDIMVLPDFFRWHYAVQAREPGIFASVASPNKHVPDWPRRGDPEGYFTSAAYASHGVCLSAESIHLLQEHVQPAYFAHMGRYLTKRFPHSRLGGRFTEQDGLIDRILEERQLRNAWPCASRAFHTGFWGYHRQEKTRLPGSLERRVEAMRHLIGDTAALNARSTCYVDLDGMTAPLPAWTEPIKVGEL